LLLTGTPENIAPVREGDLLECSMSEGGNLISSLTEKIRRQQKPFHLM
jgi:2-keto-4-pentenoate hydratase/2-oxohepta-3-ene-1,7-dioic acid hydratase in catechol pathway